MDQADPTQRIAHARVALGRAPYAASVTTMQLGVVFPQTEFPPDPLAVRDYAQAAEDLGYSQIIAYDHVLGANPERPGGLHGPYTHLDPFLSRLRSTATWPPSPRG